MKIETTNYETELNKTVIESIEKEKQEVKYIGSMLKRPGLRLYSFNVETQDIEEVLPEQSLEFDKVSGQRVINRMKVQVNPKCIYGQALNKKNFVRKLINKGILRIVPVSKNENH